MPPWRTTAHDLDAELLLRQGALDWWFTRFEIAASILGVIAFAIFAPGADKLLGLLVPALFGFLTLISSSWLAVTADSVVDHSDRGSTPKRVSRTQVASVHRRWTGCRLQGADGAVLLDTTGLSRSQQVRLAAALGVEFCDDIGRHGA